MDNLTGGIISAVLTVVCTVIGILQLMHKGFLLNNAFIFASTEERKKLDKKLYYIQSGVILLLLGGVFFCLTLSTFVSEKLFYLAIVIAVLTIIFSVASTIKIEARKKNNTK